MLTFCFAKERHTPKASSRCDAMVQGRRHECVWTFQSGYPSCSGPGVRAHAVSLSQLAYVHTKAAVAVMQWCSIQERMDRLGRVAAAGQWVSLSLSQL